MLGGRARADTTDWRKLVLEEVARVIRETGGLPSCPDCGREMRPHPLPQIVGLNWWTCSRGTIMDHDYQLHQTKPNPDWRLRPDHHEFIVEAYALSLRATSGGQDR